MATKEKVPATPTMNKLMKSKAPTAATTKVAAKKTAVDALNNIDPVNEIEGESLVTATPVTDDLLAKEINEISNLKEEKAFKLLASFSDESEHNNFKLGGILLRISSEGWYMNVGYENFAAYLEAETDIGYRKARYLIDIYSGLSKSGVTWAQVSHIGWTKIKELAVHLTKDNLEEWLAKIDGLTVADVRAKVKAETAADKKISDTESVSKKTVTMSFKLHEDQRETIREALEKAKHESGTEVDSVALEFIALDFLSGNAKGSTAQLSLKELMGSKSAEQVLELFMEVFPDVELEQTADE